MKRVDIHTHILPEDIPDFKEKFGYGGFIKLEDVGEKDKRMMTKDTGEKFRLIECNCYCPKKRIEECDGDGVTMQILSTVPVMFSYWAKPEDTLEISRFLNDHIASICSKYPQRFRGLATLPMNNIYYAIRELERCIKELGLVGVQIGTHINGKNLDDPEFYPFYEKVQELGAVIFIHPWDMLAEERMQPYWLRWLVGMPAETSLAICSLIFSGVYQKFPNLKTVFAHGGGGFIGTLGRIQHGFNVRPDLYPEQCSPQDYLKNIYVDSLVHDEDMLLKLVKTLGSDHVLLGTDYPFPLGELNPGKLVSESCLDEKDKENILWKNAYKIFEINDI